jgi:hypothetical protein
MRSFGSRLLSPARDYGVLCNTRVTRLSSTVHDVTATLMTRQSPSTTRRHRPLLLHLPGVLRIVPNLPLQPIGFALAPLSSPDISHLHAVTFSFCLLSSPFLSSYRLANQYTRVILFYLFNC